MGYIRRYWSFGLLVGFGVALLTAIGTTIGWDHVIALGVLFAVGSVIALALNDLIDNGAPWRRKRRGQSHERRGQANDPLYGYKSAGPVPRSGQPGGSRLPGGRA